MSRKSGISIKQEYETQGEIIRPVPDSASMTWNGYMTKHFNDRLNELERRVNMNSDRICAIETRNMIEDNCEQARIQG